MPRRLTILLLLAGCGEGFVPPQVPADAPPLLTEGGPDHDALWADGELRVGVMIGSMAKEHDPWREDEGVRATEWFVGWLEDRGFVRTGWGRYERGGGWPVVVRLVGADRYKLYDPPALHRSYLRDLLGWSELFYLGGHARQPGLQALAEADTYGGRRPRVLLLDVCWSYPLYARDAVDHGGGHVIHVTNRTVTGSVESLPLAIDALTQADPRWDELIEALNRRAGDRAALRAGQADEHLLEAEVYGASGPVL